MNTDNGIAYADKRDIALKVTGIKPLTDHRLWLRFNNGESRIFDFTSLLERPCYSALKNDDIFRDVYIDYGVPVWCNGDIDISPEYVYENSILYNEAI